MSEEIIEKLNRLENIGADLGGFVQLNNQDRIFLADALIKISNGMDANEALEVKSRKGVSKGKAAQDSFSRKKLLSAVVDDLIKNQGLTVDEASVRAAKFFNYTEDTIRTYIGKNKI